MRWLALVCALLVLTACAPVAAPPVSVQPVQVQKQVAVVPVEPHEIAQNNSKNVSMVLFT